MHYSVRLGKMNGTSPQQNLFFFFLFKNSCDRAGEELPASVTQSQGCITPMCEVEHPQIQPAVMSCTLKHLVISKGKPEFIEQMLQSYSENIFMSILWIAEKCIRK